jgi:hypothetical protein
MEMSSVVLAKLRKKNRRRKTQKLALKNSLRILLKINQKHRKLKKVRL